MSNSGIASICLTVLVATFGIAGALDPSIIPEAKAEELHNVATVAIFLLLVNIIFN